MRIRKRINNFSFNPRTHEGCDGARRVGGRLPGFQSTHPRGVRLYQILYFLNKRSFNPRTHEGCDGCVASPCRQLPFQSTHPRGVRPLNSVNSTVLDSVSIHAPTRGATGSNLLKYFFLNVSIHAPTRGATLCSY